MSDRDPDWLAKEAARRRALLAGAKHSEPGPAHTRSRERSEVTARIAEAAHHPTPEEES